jgi:hypothetical protein
LHEIWCGKRKEFAVILCCTSFNSLHSDDWNAEQNSNIKTVTKSFENLTRFKYLGTIVTTQNYIHKDAEQIHVKKICNFACFL